MTQASPTVYTDVSQEQYDAFRYQARGRGLNISTNSETVEFDRVPVTFKYTPETKTLTVTVAEPHWLTPGVTVGVIHNMLNTVMSGKDVVPISARFRVTPPALPGPVIGAAYSQQTLQAAGGTPPYTWAIVTGKLPAGLTLSKEGVISGTPTEAASTAPVVVAATDISKPPQTAAQELSINATGIKAKAA